jgi:cyclophilin family peptidyl-prolyl cis-trans isomerase
MGLPGAPFIMLNGEPYRTALSEVNLEAAVSLTLFEQRQFDAEPEMNLDQQANYEARIELTSGEHLVANLYPNAAPRAINNFLFLARQGYYDDIPFYRVLPGLWVESGDPSGTGFGDPGYFIPQEIDPVLHFDRPGVLAMNSPSPGLSGGRFVITLTALPQLDGQMTIIGQVREGLEQLEALMARDPFLDLLIVPEFMIETIEIEVSR